jgi:hypothetical protein
MTEPVPGHIIEAVCDDPRHARGKVYEAATFGRFTLPSGEIRWLVRNGDFWSYTVRPRESPRGRVDAHRRYYAEPEKGSTYVWPCRLCTRSFEVREENLQRVLETVYQGQLTADTLDRPISLAALRRVASTVAAHQIAERTGDAFDG